MKNIQIPTFIKEKELALHTKIFSKPESQVHPESVVEDQSAGLKEATRIVTEIAAGNYPYADGHSTPNGPELDPQSVLSLCKLVSNLLDVNTAPPRVSDGKVTLPPGIRRPLDVYLAQIEKAVILEALKETKWNRTQAAHLLGLSFRSLRYRLEALEKNKFDD